MIQACRLASSAVAAAHHEDPDRRVVLHAGVDILEPAVEPAQPLLVVAVVAPAGSVGPKSTSPDQEEPLPRMRRVVQGPMISRCGVGSALAIAA